MKLEGSIHIGGQDHFYLEPFSCVAIPKGENGEMEMFSTTQWLTGTQDMVAKALGVPANRVVARVKRIGKNIRGMKISYYWRASEALSGVYKFEICNTYIYIPGRGYCGHKWSVSEGAAGRQG